MLGKTKSGAWNDMRISAIKSARVISLFLFLSSFLMPVSTLAVDTEKSLAMAPIVVVSDEIEPDTKQLEKRVLALLNAKDYDGLDKLAASLQNSKQEYPNGKWKLDYFFSSFYENKKFGEFSDGQFSAAIDKVYDWIKAKPSSLPARIAHASLMIRYAWKARGGGMADTVSKQGWDLMEKREATALQVLMDARKLPNTCPYWWFLMLYLAKDQSRPKEYSDQLLLESRLKYPTYKRVIFMRSLDLDERWGGNPGDFERFAAEQSRLTGGAAGDEIYAQIAWAMENNHWYTVKNFYSSLNLSWPTIKKGFVEISRKYPGALSSTSEYCLLACMAGDYQTARPLFAALKGRVVKDAWRNEFAFSAMRDAAFAAK